MLFISYKYTSIKDKDLLKRQLLEIADKIHDLGHETFLLGRDNDKWSTSNHLSAHKYWTLLKNIVKSDGLVVIYVSDVNSFGMLFELSVALILGKKLYFLHKDGLKKSFFHGFAAKTVSFNPDTISESVKELLG